MLLLRLRHRLPTAVIVAVGAVVVAVVALAVTMETSTYDIWGAFWIGPVLAVLTVPIARSAAARAKDPQMGRIVMLAFTAKVIVGTVLRYVTVFSVYDRGGDSRAYDLAGKVLAPMFRDGVYRDLGKITATRFIEVLTGQVYAIVGPTRLGGFLVFSWLSFLGLWLLYRAFEIGVPNGNHRRYLFLVLFFPTLAYWPSSIGKDAWMVFCLGLASYGIARLLTGRLLGVIPVGLGFWGAAVVRPHVTLMLAIAGVLAAIIRPFAPRALRVGGGRRVTSVLVAVLMVGGVVVIVNRAEALFSIDNLNPESATNVFEEVNRTTSQGGSEFEAPSPTTPTGFAIGFVTVLFRPFPFEADSALQLISAAEGLLLLALMARWYRSLLRIPGSMVRSPWATSAVVYVLGFVYAFSAIENFGILARQRCQVLPFLFVLFSLERPPPKGEPAEVGPVDERAPVGAA